MTAHNEQTTKREAFLIQNDGGGVSTRAHYRWNTGEISLVSVPANFRFDPANAIRPAHYQQSTVATDFKME